MHLYQGFEACWYKTSLVSEMVLSSKFGYNPYASGAGKTPGKAVAPSGVPVSSSHSSRLVDFIDPLKICSTGIVAPGSHLSLSPQSPSFSSSALDHSSDVGLEDDHFTDVNEIVDSLSGLPPAALKEIGRIVRASKEPLTQPRPIIRTAVDPRAASRWPTSKISSLPCLLWYRTLADRRGADRKANQGKTRGWQAQGSRRSR